LFSLKCPELLYLILIGLSFPLQVLSQVQQPKKPLGEFQIRVLKRNQKHLNTAALICALHLEKEAQANKLQSAWSKQFPIPVSVDDQTLVIITMQEMCPEIKPEKFVLH